MKTAGVLNLLDALAAESSDELVERGSEYLFAVLESQPGYECARDVEPGSLQQPCDLCDFFGPYEERSLPDVLKLGTREMNAYREFEPLLAPKSPVRHERRSSRDRVGPSSCYSWGLLPLTYTIEALCRAGHAEDPRLAPAVNALLGAQRDSGGWCRNLSGHPACTVHAVRALGAHPLLRKSEHAERAVAFMLGNGATGFAQMQAAAAFDLPVARAFIRQRLAAIAPRQRKNGTFGAPCQIERVAAALVASRALV